MGGLIIMNNKKHYIFFIVYTSLLITTIITMFTFNILGKKERNGYLNDINIDPIRTLEINEKTNIINNYISNNNQINISQLREHITNNNNEITNYIYSFSISYYDKIFRSSDIYNVYLNTNEIIKNNIFIQNIKMNPDGSRFGFFNSSKIIDTNSNIDIKYTLKIKSKFIMHLSIIFISILLLYLLFYLYIKFISNKLKNIYNNKNLIISNIDFNLDYTENNKNNKFFNIIFIIFVFLYSLFILGFGNIIPVFGDDFIFATDYEVYNIWNFILNFWSRGRHIGDNLILLNMKPIGMFFMQFGMNPFWALKTSQTILYYIYFLSFFFTISYMVYLFNNKKNFKTIFFLISPLSFYLFLHFEVSMFYVRVAAYVATAALAIFAWIPIGYFFVYDKEMKIFKNNNALLGFWFFVLYLGTFVQEPSVWPMAGLSFFFVVYIFIKILKPNTIYNNDNNKIPCSILYLVISHLALTITAFILTMTGIRAKGQGSRIGIENIDLLIGTFNRTPYSKIILIASIILLCIIIIRILKNKYIRKLEFIQLSLIITGLLGIAGFMYIGVYYGITMCVLFLFISVILEILQFYNKKLIVSIIVSFIIVVLCFDTWLIYINNAYTLKNRPDIIAYNLYVEAEKNNDDAIIITQDFDKDNSFLYYIPTNFAIYNSYLSKFMYQYGITSNYIPIIRIEGTNTNNIKIDTNMIFYK